jgi:hypothetical protein
VEEKEKEKAVVREPLGGVNDRDGEGRAGSVVGRVC